MRLLKPSWVSHDGHPIFSLDIHPDGSRFATGGQGEDSGRVVVWNMAPILADEDEKDENVPKMLCQMDNHLACVNCVRWSNSGKYLASGGDDKVIMIWQTGRYSGSQGYFGGGGAKVNVELWRCVSTLRGHSGDVLDLAWSVRDTWLASCSVDNSVIIWNAQKMPDMVTVLRGHSGLVKGVAWDPVGKYLASQSDDKTLRIWRTSDWHQEKVISEPFRECGGTTHVLRLSWSPDGHYLVSAHAMNNSGPTAQIVERDGWKTGKDFVGHRKAITCVRFNPNILSKVVKVAGKVQHYCCCAIGSRDRSLSIWLTALKRPLVVIHDLFSNSILDVSWSHKGDQIMACSWDGTVASLGFTEEEIGKPLSDEQKDSFYQKMYGKSFSSNNIANSFNTIIENPELLKLKETQEKDQQKVKESDHQKNKVVVQAKGPLNRQIETITADGRRRITPMFIAPAPDLGRDIPLPFNSRPQPTFSSSTERQSKILIEKRDETPTTPCVTSSPGLTTVITTTTSGNSDIPHVTITAIPTSATSTPSDTPQPLSASKPVINGMSTANDIVKIIQIPQQSQPMTGVTISAVPGTPTSIASDILKLNDVKKDKTKESYKPSVKVIDVRKELAKPQMKRGPGRPPLSDKMTHQLVHQSVHQATQDREVQPQTRPSTLHGSSDLHLPPLRADRNHSVQVSVGKGEPSMLLELENSVSVTSCIVVHKLKCTRNDKSWEVILPAKGCAAAGSKHLVCAVCEDGSLSIYSLYGRRLHPSLILTSMASRLTCNGYHIMVITSRGFVTVWDLKHRSVLVKNESLLPIMSGAANDLTISSTSLTDHGSPVVSLSVGKSYMYSPEMGCWILIHNAEDMMQQCSDYHSCLPSQLLLNGTSLPLAALQSQFQRPSQQAQRLFRSNPSMQQASTLCHIDNQLTAAMSLNSSKEFKFWLLTLTRYLVQEGLEDRLRELCDSLLVAVSSCYSKHSDDNDSYIQGLHKHDLLQEILPIIGSNLQMQRLFAEYQEQLDLSKI